MTSGQRRPGIPKRMGFQISDEGFERIESVRKKYGLSQGVALERIILTLTDDDYERLLKDAANRPATRRELVKQLNALTEEELKAFKAALDAVKATQQ